jgi:hypothetical protein
LGRRWLLAQLFCGNFNFANPLMQGAFYDEMKVNCCTFKQSSATTRQQVTQQDNK